MSLTNTDLNKIEGLIDKKLKINNDELFGRLMEVLKHFPTRTEMYDELQKLSDQMVKRAEFLELKDDVATIKVELHEFRLFAEHNLNRHEQDIQLVKSHLRLR